MEVLGSCLYPGLRRQCGGSIEASQRELALEDRIGEAGERPLERRKEAVNCPSGSFAGHDLFGERQKRDDLHEFRPVGVFRIAELPCAPARQEVVAAHLHVMAGRLVNMARASASVTWWIPDSISIVSLAMHHQLSLSQNRAGGTSRHSLRDPNPADSCMTHRTKRRPLPWRSGGTSPSNSSRRRDPNSARIRPKLQCIC